MCAECNKWMNIETAPKDGTCILLGYFLEMGGGGGPEIAHWDSARKLWHGRGGPLNADGYFSPTHWLPLPSPPAPSPPEPASEVAVVPERKRNPHVKQLLVPKTGDTWYIVDATDSWLTTRYLHRDGTWNQSIKGDDGWWPTEADAAAFLQNLQTERGMG